MGIGLKKSEQVKGGGGLWKGGEGLIKECRVVPWDYNGTINPPVTALAVTIEPTEDDEQDEFTQYYSAGNQKYVRPSKDSLKFENAPGQSRAGVTEDTNAGLFLGSLMEPMEKGAEGFPEERVSDEVDVFEGTLCNFKRVEQPERNIKEKKVKGVSGKEELAKSEYPKEILLVESIVKFPWEKKGTKKAAVAEDEDVPVKKKAKVEEDEEEAPAKKATKAENGGIDPGVSKLAQKYVIKVLAANEEGLLKKKLGTEVFALAKKEDEADKIIEAVYDDDWLGDDARPWTFNPKTSMVTP